MKKILLEYNFDELAQIVESFGAPKYRTAQLYRWLNSGYNFSQMSNLPKSFLDDLAKEYEPSGVEILHVPESKDGSKKYLFKLLDGNLIESVFMPHSYGNSVCVSTQAGCRMGCAFCSSGIGGLARNLTAGEILSQITAITGAEGGKTDQRTIKNIVLMGSGEPLDNFDNVLKFLSLVTDERGLGISARNISLSTCGIVPQMRRLADSGFHVTLSVSLHATTDEFRNKVMPISKKYTIDEVLNAAKYYFEKTGRRIIIEYIALRENTNHFDAKRLKELLKGCASHINIIPLNKAGDCGFEAATAQKIERFIAKLAEMGVSATARRSMGSDIEGACGQLRNKFVGEK